MEKEPYEVMIHENGGVFVWLSANKITFRPQEMESSYLINTLRMVWNHLATEPLQITPFKAYDFSDEPVYSARYFRLCLSEFIQELDRRRDLSESDQKAVIHIKSHKNEIIKNLSLL
tara:strand:- start:586 stop:936 length:351 start_codon:yes stop_codon:yes gene_type:complete